MERTSAAENKWESGGLFSDGQYTNNSEQMDTIKIAVMEDPWFYYGTSGVNTKRDTQSIKQKLDSLIDQIDEDAFFASHNVANWDTFDVAEKEALSPQLLGASIFKSSINNAMEVKSIYAAEETQEKPIYAPTLPLIQNSEDLTSVILKKIIDNKDAQMLSILDLSPAQMSSAVNAVFDIIDACAPLQSPEIINLSHALKYYFGSGVSYLNHYEKASLLLAIEDSFNDFVASSNVNLLASDSVDMALI